MLIKYNFCSNSLNILTNDWGNFNWPFIRVILFPPTLQISIPVIASAYQQAATRKKDKKDLYIHERGEYGL